MDFNFSDEQIALRDLAREILEKEVSPELLKEIEAQDGGDWFAREIWTHLAEANLLGLAVPEEHGGMGFGVVEVCLLLQEMGRCVAPLPLLSTLVLAGLPIARFGSDEQKRRFLPRLASGELILSGALTDAHSGDPLRPATTARREGEDWILDGLKLHVPSARLAERILVPAATDDGVAVFLVDPAGNGAELRRQQISTYEPIFELKLDRARVAEADRLGGPSTSGGKEADERRSEGGRNPMAFMWDSAIVGVAATQIGVSERALEITTHYVSQRHQFGAPIGTFPAVQHRAADGYIDLEALRWTTWRAAWRLSEGLSATREAMVAKFWAAEGGNRIANSAQHLHGGMGVDRDYPIHRYFLWSKSLELNLGGAIPQLVRLGADMARTGPQENA